MSFMGVCRSTTFSKTPEQLTLVSSHPTCCVFETVAMYREKVRERVACQKSSVLRLGNHISYVELKFMALIAAHGKQKKKRVEVRLAGLSGSDIRGYHLAK